MINAGLRFDTQIAGTLRIRPCAAPSLMAFCSSSGMQQREILVATAAAGPLWRIKSEYDTLPLMPRRSCRVTIRDLEGVAHTVDVTAESLFEAVAQGLAALRGNQWVTGIAQGVVKVSVAD